MKKVLTILVPVYNTEKYLKRCLDSILLKEILNDIDVILVNDGSKDSSVEILKQYEKEYPDVVTVVDKENGGHGSTVNKGIELAKTKYFRVLDSDDWVNCEDFILFVKRLKKEDADLVVTNYRQEHIYNSSSIFLPYKNLKENKVYDFNKFDLKILNGEYFVMATSTYKLSVLKNSKVKLMEKTFYVDMIYNIVPIPKVKNFVFYDLDIYRYFIGRKDQSMNLQSFVRNQDHHERVMKYLIEYYTKEYIKLSENKKDYIFMILRYMLNTHYTIYCIYDKNHRQAYKKIKVFDAYLKETNIKLYNGMNDISYIKGNRKCKFIFVRINGKLFKKILVFASRVFK